MKKLLILALITSSAMATELEIASDKNLSQVLIDNGLIKSDLELHKVKSVLDENNLDWKTAKSLPVGYKFKAESLKDFEPQVITKEVVVEKRIKVRTGWDSFATLNAVNEELQAQDAANNNRTLYSGLSQQVGIGVNVGIRPGLKFINHLKLTHSQYYESDVQNTAEDYNRLTYSFDTGAHWDNERQTLRGGLNLFSLNYFNVDSQSLTRFSRTNGTALFGEFKSFIPNSGNSELGLRVVRHLTSDDIDTFNEFTIFSDRNVNLFGKRLKFTLGYGESEFSVDSKEFKVRTFTIGLKKKI